jgi:hypothetical protein
VVAGLPVRATGTVVGEQLMADGYMSDDAPGQERARAPSPALRSEMSWSTPDRIMVRGFDRVDDLLGKVDLGDMAFLELMGRPTANRRYSTPCWSPWWNMG